MSRIRHHLLQHPMAALLVVALAMLMRLIVPAGFMSSANGKTITLVLCTGYGPQTIDVAIPAASGTRHDHGQEQGSKAGTPCVFSGLVPALSGADPLLLAAAVLFVLPLAIRTPARQPTAPALRLRPPLRGPPALG